jgi:Predicted metal-binding, possibly nucleic acid-binding protein
LGKFDKYKVELKNMKADSAQYEFQLNNQFFVDLDGPEVQKGKLTVQLIVKKSLSGVFVLDFQTEGHVVVPCDRCLDDMEIPILTKDKLKVKLGDDFSEDGDIVVVPESDGYINIAWFVYEFIALNIPMKHVHAPGKCNKDMMGKLSKHLKTTSDDQEDDMPIDLSDDMMEELNDDSQETDPRWNELKKY